MYAHAKQTFTCFYTQASKRANKQTHNIFEYIKQNKWGKVSIAISAATAAKLTQQINQSVCFVVCINWNEDTNNNRSQKFVCVIEPNKNKQNLTRDEHSGAFIAEICALLPILSANITKKATHLSSYFCLLANGRKLEQIKARNCVYISSIQDKL